MGRHMHRGDSFNLQSSRGFTYLGLLFILVLMSMSLALAGTLWSFVQKRECERELLFIGQQFRQAIANYYERTPGSVKRYPNNLQDLLEDKRYLSTQRYLRKIYMDPVTSSQDWGVVRAPDGGIMGVFSRAEQQPLKVDGFRFQNQAFERAASYKEWVFVYRPIGI